MTQMLSGKDLAKLQMDLHVPSLLSDILSRDEALAASDDCLLRQAFAELSPLESLISIACCLHVLVPHLAHERNIIEPLTTHADYILDDYAPHWMRHSFPASREWAEFVQHDLELTGDFLAIISDAAIGVHPAISDICDILNEQAFVKSMNQIPVIDFEPDIMPVADNVIRFPVERRI